MRVDKVLFVSDSNLNYLSFWNSISKYYSTVLGLKCKLFFIGAKDSTTAPYLSEEYGEVEVVEPIPDIPIIIQALWAKFWYTQTEPDTNWLIGDIDLYILDKDGLFNTLSKIPEGGYGHLCAQDIGDGKWYFIGFSHVASGKTFKEYLELTDDFEAECRMIYNSKKYGCISDSTWKAPDRVKDKKDWEYICCEEHLSIERLMPRLSSLSLFTQPKDRFRLETPHAYHGLNTPADFNIVDVFNTRPKEHWLDFHCPRPYTLWAEQIETILNNYLRVSM